jgi:hypothetical protein
MFVDRITASRIVRASPDGGLGRVGAKIIGIQTSETVYDMVKILHPLPDLFPSRQKDLMFGL